MSPDPRASTLTSGTGKRRDHNQRIPPLRNQRMRNRVRDEAECARLNALFRSAQTQHAFSSDHIDPFRRRRRARALPRIAQADAASRCRSTCSRAAIPCAPSRPPMKFFSRNSGTGVTFGSPGAPSPLVGAGGGATGSGAFGGGGAADSATSTVGDSPARNVTSRSRVTEASCAKRRR